MNSILIASAIFSATTNALPTPPRSANDVYLELRAEGYTHEQSQVDSLLELIRRGEALEESEPDSYELLDSNSPYHILGRYKPYSEAISVKILDLILDAIKTQNRHVDLNILFIEIISNPIHTPAYMNRLAEIMRSLETSEHKRRAAIILSSYPLTRFEAIETLRHLLDEFAGQPISQALTAFSLIKLGTYNAESEAILIQQLQTNHTAMTIIMYAISSDFSGVISEHLHQALQNSLLLFPEGMRPSFQADLNKITLRRMEAQQKTLECVENLKGGDNIILFPPRRRLGVE